MTSTAPAASPPLTAWRGIVGDASAALRGITADQLVGTVLLGLAASMPTVLQLVRELGVSGAWPEVWHLIAGSVIKACCLLLAVVLADRAVDQGGRRTFAYVTAVVAGVVIGSIVYWLLLVTLTDLTSNVHALAIKAIPMIRYTILANSIFEWLIIAAWRFSSTQTAATARKSSPICTPRRSSARRRQDK